MIRTDYPIEALPLLLDRSCLLTRYHSLVPYTGVLLSGLRALGCRAKSEAAALPDEAFLRIGLPDTGAVHLFRGFLTLYDPEPKKLLEIDALTDVPAERKTFRELYCLPGVRQIRAALYCRAGLCTLRDIAETAPADILARTAETIRTENLTCAVPLPKEVRTHVAVTKALTML